MVATRLVRSVGPTAARVRSPRTSPGEMDDDLGLDGADQVGRRAGALEVADVPAGSRHVWTRQPGGGDDVAAGTERVEEMAADQPGRAGDQHAGASQPLRRSVCHKLILQLVVTTQAVEASARPWAWPARSTSPRRRGSNRSVPIAATVSGSGETTCTLAPRRRSSSPSPRVPAREASR